MIINLRFVIRSTRKWICLLNAEGEILLKSNTIKLNHLRHLHTYQEQFRIAGRTAHGHTARFLVSINGIPPSLLFLGVTSSSKFFSSCSFGHLSLFHIKSKVMICSLVKFILKYLLGFQWAFHDIYMSIAVDRERSTGKWKLVCRSSLSIDVDRCRSIRPLSFKRKPGVTVTETNTVSVRVCKVLNDSQKTNTEFAIVFNATHNPLIIGLRTI